MQRADRALHGGHQGAGVRRPGNAAKWPAMEQDVDVFGSRQASRPGLQLSMTDIEAYLMKS